MNKKINTALFVVLAVLTFAVVKNIPNFVFYYRGGNDAAVSEGIVKAESRQISKRIESRWDIERQIVSSVCDNLKLNPDLSTINGLNHIIKLTFKSPQDCDLFKRTFRKTSSVIGGVFNVKLCELYEHNDHNEAFVITTRRHSRQDLASFLCPYKINSQKYNDLTHRRAKFLANKIDCCSDELVEMDSFSNDISVKSICSKVAEIYKQIEDKDHFANKFVQWTHKNINIKRALFNLKNWLSAENKRLANLIEEKSDFANDLASDVKQVSIVLSILDRTIEEKQNDFETCHPLIKCVRIDGDVIVIELEDWAKHDCAKKWLDEEIDRIKSDIDKEFYPTDDGFNVRTIKDSSSTYCIVLDSDEILRQETNRAISFISDNWSPKSNYFKRDRFPLLRANDFISASQRVKKFCVLFFAPSLDGHCIPKLNNKSVYAVAFGLNSALETKTDKDIPNPIKSDALALLNTFQQLGFQAYATYQLGLEYLGDAVVFSLDTPWASLIESSKEDFVSTDHMPMIHMSSIKQRMHSNKKIENLQQQELIRWKDYYNKVTSNKDNGLYLAVPKPFSQPLLSNITNKLHRFLRADEDYVLKLGIDLSGGKCVRICLLDNNGKKITSKDQISQGREEILRRVNRLGVSEVCVKIEDDHILMEFPGSQNLSANELIEASSMRFHIVNERFQHQKSPLLGDLDRFLQDVWSESKVSNRYTIEDLNDIAYRKLTATTPPSYCTSLIESGFILPEPGTAIENTFNDQLCLIAPVRTAVAYTDSNKHQLIVLIRNYVIDGSDLQNIQTSYDSTKGHFLSFGIKTFNQTGQYSPTEKLFEWTNEFCKENISGSPRQLPGTGRGWRMAVLLNGEVVSCPELQSALTSGGSIFGRFSQSEIDSLCKDLKAGSLSFKPKILSEENISSEISNTEKTKSLMGFAIALSLVVLIMTSYYGIWGIVASTALAFNLLLMSVAMQELGATLTLSGVAGIVLTLGMAVDSNVLVFERIREELDKKATLQAALKTGYHRALNAVIDSNITTLIASITLAMLNCGPIRGFGVCLSIGLFTSVFTSVFVTKTFLFWLFENKKHYTSRMSKLINIFGSEPFPFLGWSKTFVTTSFLLVVLGFYGLISNRSSLLWLDLTGGTVVDVECSCNKDGCKEQLESVLYSFGIDKNHYRVQQRSSPNKLRMFFSKSSRAPRSLGEFSKILKDCNNDQHRYDNTSSWSTISGQLSKTMRYNSLLAIALSLALVTVYISVRFEFIYAFASLIGIVYNLIMTASFVGLLKLLGIDISIDLPAIGALLTSIGYCLNDTIIIFDRIREESNLVENMSHKSGCKLIERSIGATMGRTIMTCLTTMVVVVCSIIFGGTYLMSFSLVMATGVILGPISSIFAASGILSLLIGKK